MSPAGQQVRLTTGEFDLLAAFVNNPNQVLSRDRLLDLARNREAGPFGPDDRRAGRPAAPQARRRPQNPSLIKTVRGSAISSPDRRIQLTRCLAGCCRASSPSEKTGPAPSSRAP